VQIPEKLRHRLHTIIYEADTPAGKFFDMALLAIILLSVAALLLESVAPIKMEYGKALSIIEWTITIFFTIEYIFRALSVRRPLKYILSFYGIIDLLATLPTYVDLLFPGFHYLLALRAVRLLRVFRILKLMHFVGASNLLLIALLRSRTKILVFLYTVLVLAVIMGTIMYMVEGPQNGFTSIPVAIYWTIVTMTTVGFGDITPSTPLGQVISSIIMIIGYGIIAVPTGIVTSELTRHYRTDKNTQACPDCAEPHHRDDAFFCFHCGARLNS
jgi:voltage-gated potassium channel